MKTQLLSIQYARCTKWTAGQLDCAPFSAYKTATANVTLNGEPSPDFDGEMDWTVILVDNVIGWGSSPNEAIANAQYTLMKQSREQSMGYAH